MNPEEREGLVRAATEAVEPVLDPGAARAAAEEKR